MSVPLHTWELAKALLIGTGVLLFCGYGLARLLLPESWRPPSTGLPTGPAYPTGRQAGSGQGYGWYAVPGLGLAGVIVVASWLTLLLPMKAAAWVTLLLFAGVNVVAWRWRGWPDPLTLSLPTGQAGLSKGERSPSSLMVRRADHERDLPTLENEALEGNAPSSRVEGAAVLALALVVLGIGLYPMVGRPELTAVGPNWDFEIYLPLAEYIREVPVGFSLEHTAGLPFSGPPNPLLWRLNFFDTRSGGLGFSLFHSLVSVLAGQEAHQNFSALLALLLAASIPSIYLFYRAALRLSSRVALAALGLVALNGAVFFIFFWSFAQQVASLVLMPLALAAGAQAMLEGHRRAVLLGGLMLAALLATFTPVAPLYVTAMGLLTVGLVVRRRDAGPAYRPGRRAGWAEPFDKALRLGPSTGLRTGSGQAQDKLPGRGQVVTAMVLLAITSVALGPMSYARLLARATYFVVGGGIGGLSFGPSVLQFVPMSWAYGLGPLELPQDNTAGLPAAQTEAVLGVLSGGLVTAVVLLSLLGLRGAYKNGNLLLLTFGLASPLLLVLVRFVWSYPYGYLKLIPSCVFLLVAVLAYGVGVLWRRLWYPPRQRSVSSLWFLGLRGLRLAMLCFLAFLVGLNLLMAYLSVQQARVGSGLAFNSLEKLEQVVPPGSSVYVSSHPGLQGPRGGALAYFLRKAELYGDFNTAYSTLFRFKPDGIYDYMLFRKDETAYPEIFDGEEPVIEAGELKLYGRPRGALWLLEFGQPEAAPRLQSVAGRTDLATWSIDGWLPNGYPDSDGWSAPLLGFMSRESPPPAHYPQGDNTRPFTLAATAQGLALSPSQEWGASGEKAQREVAVTIATLQEQTVRLLIGDEERSALLPPGLSSYYSGPVAVPTKLALGADGGTALYIKSAQLRLPGDAGERVVRHEEGVLLRSEVALGGSVVRGGLELLTPGFVPVLDIYSMDKRQHFGWWALPEPRGPGPQRVEYTLDLLGKQGSVTGEDGTAALPFQTWPTGDDTYLAALFLWREGEVKRAIPLFEFTLYGGTIQRFRSALPSLFIG